MWRCVVWQLHDLEWPFIVPGTRCTCVMIMLFKSAYWQATPVRWLDYVGNGEMLTDRDANKFERNKRFLCVWNISGTFYFGSWNTLHVAFIFLFSVFDNIMKHLKNKIIIIIYIFLPFNLNDQIFIFSHVVAQTLSLTSSEVFVLCPPSVETQHALQCRAGVTF